MQAPSRNERSTRGSSRESFQRQPQPERQAAPRQQRQEQPRMERGGGEQRTSQPRGGGSDRGGGGNDRGGGGRGHDRERR
jgi:hypothetical protein